MRLLLCAGLWGLVVNENHKGPDLLKFASQWAWHAKEKPIDGWTGHLQVVVSPGKQLSQGDRCGGMEGATLHRVVGGPPLRLTLEPRPEE